MLPLLICNPFLVQNKTFSMRLVVLIGQPGAGKTTVLRCTLERLGTDFGMYRLGLISGRYYPKQNVLVLGKYSDNPFSGTDCWSHQYYKDLHRFFQTVPPSVTIVGEGNKITTRRFLDTALEYTKDLSLVVLTAPDHLTQERREGRGPQKSAWVKGIATRVANIQADYPHSVLENRTLQDMTTAANHIYQKITGVSAVIQHTTTNIYNIIKNPDNYRLHPPDQLDDLRASLKRYGQIENVVVKQQGNKKFLLIAGEGITTAGLSLLEEDPEKYKNFLEWGITIVPDHWTEIDVNGYMMTANESSRKSTISNTQFASLLQEQQKQQQALESLGMTPLDVAAIVASANDGVREDLMRPMGRVMEMPDDPGRVYEHGDDGVKHGRSQDVYLDQFENTTLRQIIIVYHKEDYARVMREFTRLREKYDLDTHAEVVEMLLKNYLSQEKTGV
jgi:hypothetical protein